MHGQPARLPAIGLRRIVVMRPDNIGDVVMAAPAVRALRQEFPDAEITLLLSPAGAQAAPLLPWADDVIVDRVSWQQLPADGEPWDPDRDAALIARLRQGRFDAAFVLTSFSQSPWPAAYASLLAGIQVRVGRELGFGGALLTHAAPPLPDGSHQAERNLDLLEWAGIPVADRRPAIAIPDPARAAAGALLAERGITAEAPYAVMAPGASCDARRLPTGLASDIVRGLLHDRDRGDTPLVLVGGPRDVTATQPIAALDGVRSIVGKTSIAELAAVIAGARIVITAHSAPMHLADAVGTPVVVAFSGTDRESEWAPRSAPARLLRRDTPCAPCRGLTCPIGLPCLDLDPQAVLAAVDDLLAEPAAIRSAA
jgi:ADP-heptose:LPS heptosyltransferase